MGTCMRAPLSDLAVVPKYDGPRTACSAVGRVGERALNEVTYFVGTSRRLQPSYYTTPVSCTDVRTSNL